MHDDAVGQRYSALGAPVPGVWQGVGGDEEDHLLAGTFALSLLTIMEAFCVQRLICSIAIIGLTSGLSISE